ncbi:MAG: SMC family ATPase [Caldilineaceae bacterium]|nr:SMC family ATPase [Caldilineaceae bacterium]
MRIVALDLQNTKSYEKSHIEFTDGVNAIVGHNGAGKSTVLEAIGFALFDCLTGYKQSDFVREGAKSAEITVTIVSGLDDRSYQVVRRCGASNHHSIFDPELGTRVCEGKADVLQFLRQHMGVDQTADLSRLFSDAVGVPQGTFTAAFLQTPAQRKTTFDPLLQVEEYKQAFDKLLEPVRTLQTRQHELDVEMAGFAGRLERLPLLETAIAERKSALARAEEQVQTLAIKLQRVTDQRSALDEIQQRVAALRNQQQQAEQRKLSITTQLQNAEKAKAEAAAAAAVVAEHQPAHDQHVAAQAEQKTLDAASRERQTLERKQSELDKALSISKADVTRLTAELAQVAAAEQQMAALAPAVTEQEQVERELREAEQQSSRLADAQAQLATLETRRTTLEKRLATLTTQLTEATSLEQKRQTAETALETLRVQIDSNKEALVRFKTEADALKEQSSALETIETARCPVCEQPLTPDHLQSLQARNQSRLDELRAHYRTQQQAIKQGEAEQKSLQTTLQQVQQQLRALPREDERTLAQEELKSARDALATQQEQVTAFAAAPAQVSTIQQRLAALGDPRQKRAVAAATAARRPQIEAQIEAAQAKILRAQAEVDALQTTLAQFATLDADLERIAHQLQASAAGYQTVLRNQQVAATLDARGAEVTALQAEAQTAAAAVADAMTALTNAEAQFDAARYQRLLAEEQLLRNQQQECQTELTLLQREQTREQTELAQLIEQQHTLETLQTQSQRVTQQRETLEALRNLLRQAGPFITKALIRQISDGAAQVFSDIMQDYSRHLRWTEDYGITLEVDGRERQFAQLSGGEQMSAALSVRLALLREMSNIDVAFFDEPTTNLDQERRDALARQIIDVKGFRQLFLISHDDTFEQATQNLIRVARINGVSTILQD